MANLFNPLELMRLRTEGLSTVVAATMFPKTAHLRWNPQAQDWRGHQGWDLYATTGTSAFAVADGYVVWTRDQGDFGKQVLLQFNKDGSAQSSSDSIYAFYAHLSKILVEPFTFVTGGQKIALTGTSGNASPAYPHLHFEIRTTSGDLPQGLTGRLDPSTVLGGQLLSCTTETIGGVDLVSMVCRATDQATPVSQ
jgi:murein DD-endopeptidase MepM/ murein hydrolase activator NlpD